jgi:predicted nucleic acid-binding Zn ribbon protein
VDAADKIASATCSEELAEERECERRRRREETFRAKV